MASSFAARADPFLPVVRVVILEGAMLTASSAMWPAAFDPAEASGNSAQLGRSFSSAPVFHSTGNPFTSDGDPAAWNILCHGLFGSEAYLAGRSHGYHPLAAFLFAAFSSWTWEYLWEGWFQQPSAIDLMWTPVGGSLIGEMRYRIAKALRGRTRARGLRAVARFAIDPLGEMERALLFHPR